MKRIFLYILSVFTLLSCRNSDDRFILSGEFNHLQQGEFYLYSPNSGREKIDTLTLKDGKFEYEIPLKNKAVLYLLYPNFTEQAIFAEGGKEVQIEGDARMLNQTVIKGTEANEAYTQFRLDNLKKSPQETADAAADFILKNPKSEVSTYLFEKYFLLKEQKDYARIRNLYQTLTQAQPDNLNLKALQNKVEGLALSAPNTEIPEIEWTDLKGDTINLHHIKDQYILLSCWANWHNSGYTLFQLKKLSKKFPKDLTMLSISLDIDSKVLERNLERDTIDWSVACDYQAWGNPVLQKLAVYDIPQFILINPEHKIIFRSKEPTKETFEKIESLIK